MSDAALEVLQAIAANGPLMVCETYGSEDPMGGVALGASVYLQSHTVLSRQQMLTALVDLHEQDRIVLGRSPAGAVWVAERE